MILSSGTAVGLSLIAWSLHRCWRQCRQEAVEVCKESRVTLPERYEEEHKVGEALAVAATSGHQVDIAGQPSPLPLPVATATVRQGEGKENPPEGGTTRGGEVEATLFLIGAGMYELKAAAAEEVPPVQIPRRAVRRRVTEQLLLWPDADEPLARPVQPSDSTTTERR